MCRHCYESFGSPVVINEKVIEAARLIRAVYEIDEVGGNLHIQLDDWNIEDRNWDVYTPWLDVNSHQEAIESKCFEAMRVLSVEERATALAIDYRFIDTEGNPVKPSKPEYPTGDRWQISYLPGCDDFSAP